MSYLLSSIGCMPPLSVNPQPIEAKPLVNASWIALVVSKVARLYKPSCLSNLFNVATPTPAFFANSAVDQPKAALAALIVLPDILLISMIAPMAIFCHQHDGYSTPVIEIFHKVRYYSSMLINWHKQKKGSQVLRALRAAFFNPLLKD